MSTVIPSSNIGSVLGDSDMARRVLAYDWSGTPLGPMERWPEALLIAVGICLNSRFPMFVWWGPSLINIYNDAYVPMLGARHPRALGRPARDSWEDIWSAVGPQADLVMKEGKATWNERVHLRMERHGYPEDTWFTWSYSPVRDETGKICGLYCAVQEDTPRVLAERERDASEAALKDADRRKDEFLAMLAHELRNPLAPISNAVQAMRLDPERKHAQAIGVMDRQVRQLVRLVDDLLDVSRITRGKVVLKKQIVALDEVLDAALETVRPLVENRGQELLVRMPHAIWLDGDRARLSQVFANILHNASKFSPRGGTISITGRAADGDVTVDVADGGIGIEKEHLASIFDIFAQADHAIERAQGGLGIGLTIVKMLLEMHGGRVEALSDGAGKGATLRVHLPTHAAPQANFPGAIDAPQPSARGLRLLIVDDNKDSAQTLGMMLKLLGHEVEVQYDGPAALEAASTFGPDAAFLDIGMPGMNGYEVCKRLRADGGDDLVVIAQTGWGDPVQRVRSQEAGFNHHLVKPVDLDTLQGVLSSIPPRRR
jgi:signal transduction histidine kinase